jgi:hypothetical protein
MIRTLISFAFILTQSVLAQAADTNAQKWVTTYSAETEVEGLPVSAHLQETLISWENPEAVLKKAYRLNLIVSKSPLVQMNFAVEPRLVIMNGNSRPVYVSSVDSPNGLHIVIVPEKDGSLHVNYLRDENEANPDSGEFALEPVPHIF